MKLPDRWDQVYCSPLTRCRRLAEQLHSHFEEDTRLQELNFGRWENQAWNDIDATELTPWMDDFVNVACPDGESYQMLAERAANFWKELTNKVDKQVALVTHAGPIRALLAHTLSLPLAHSFQLTVDYGSVSLVRVQNQLSTIQFINR